MLAAALLLAADAVLLAVGAAARLAAPRQPDTDLCIDTRFLVDVLEAQRPLLGLRHLLLTHGLGTRRDVLCREELIRLHTTGHQTFVLHAGDATNAGLESLPHRVDLVVLLLRTVDANLFNVTMYAIQRLSALRRGTPLLTVHITPLREEGDINDVHVITRAVKSMGWMHTAVALQQRSGQRSGAVPVFLSSPGYVPGQRCGFGPSRTTLAMTWTEGCRLGQDAVEFLRRELTPPMNGCVVNVAPMFKPPFVYFNISNGLDGVDVALVEYFAYAKNASIHYLLRPATNVSEPDQHLNAKAVNGMAHFGFVALEDVERADLLIGGLFPHVDGSYNFDRTLPYAVDAICGFVTARMPVPRWRYPFSVLRPRVWAALFGLVAVLVTVLRATGGFSLTHYVVIIWGVLFDGEPKPALRSGRAMFLVFLWSVFCVHFNSGYRASLATASINPLTVPGPTSLLEVKRVAFLGDKLLHLLQSMKKDAPRNLQIEICHTIANCSEQIKSDPENVAIIASAKAVWSTAPAFFLDPRMRTLMRRTETLATYYISFLVNRHSPLLHVMDRTLVMAVEHGVLVKGFNRIQYQLRMEMERQLRLKLHHKDPVELLGAFSVLSIGLSQGFCVFCCELLHHRLARRKQTCKAPSSPDIDHHHADPARVPA